MPIQNNQQLARRKNVQAGLSGASAALGVGALTAMGVKTGAGKLVRAGSKSGVLRRPVSVDRVRRNADKAMGGLTVGSVGVGGLSSANFASVQRAESKRIKKAMSTKEKTKRAATAAAGGALVVAGGRRIGPNLKWAGIARDTGDLARHLQRAGSPHNAAIIGRRADDMYKLARKRNMRAAGAAGVAGTGGYLIHRSTKVKKNEGYTMDFGLSGVRQGDISKALFPSGPVTRKVVDSGHFVARSTMSPRAGASYLSQRTTEIGRKDGALWRAKKVTVTANRMERAPGGTATAAGSFAGTSVSRTRGGPTALGAGVGAGIGAGGAGYAAGRKKRVSVEKAFDAERSRRKRLTAYSHGAAAAGGAAGLAGGRLIAVGAKDLKNAKSLPKFKAAQAKTGKGVALTAGAVGAGIAANRINEFKYRGGGSYRPRYINQ